MSDPTGNGNYCQLMGKWQLPLNGYNTIPLCKRCSLLSAGWTFCWFGEIRFSCVAFSMFGRPDAFFHGRRFEAYLRFADRCLCKRILSAAVNGWTQRKCVRSCTVSVRREGIFQQTILAPLLLFLLNFHLPAHPVLTLSFLFSLTRR